MLVPLLHVCCNGVMTPIIYQGHFHKSCFSYFRSALLCNNCHTKLNKRGCERHTTNDVHQKTKWVVFLKNLAAIGPCPIFYQYLTDQVFKDMILQHFQVNAETGNRAYSETGLTYEEDNALRYSAGYVPRVLRKKLERGSWKSWFYACMK